jgi:hypothetical protein
MNCLNIPNNDRIERYKIQPFPQTNTEHHTTNDNTLHLFDESSKNLDLTFSIMDQEEAREMQDIISKWEKVENTNNNVLNQVNEEFISSEPMKAEFPQGIVEIPKEEKIKIHEPSQIFIQPNQQSQPEIRKKSKKTHCNSCRGSNKCEIY